MDIREFIKLLRSRWIAVCVTALITLAAAIAYTLAQTPLYEAATRLFVSTSAGDSASDLYQASRYSQERVLSYSQLLMGETLAQRTIDRLNLDISAEDLKENITAKSKLNTVLIDVAVVDSSPIQARDIANALSEEFVVMVGELESPYPGAKPDARVMVEQTASIPQKRVEPKPLRNIAVGIILGGMLGIGFAFIRDQMDNTIKNADTLEATAGLSVVGKIPFDKRVHDEPEILFDQDNSAVAEAFRKLRTNLHFLSVDHPPRLIVVTSSVPDEGKTTIAINIALALAEADHNVLLVDGDMRRPSLDKYLRGIVGGVGLSTVLSGAAPLDEATQHGHVPRLTVLSAGAVPPNPSELLGSMAAKKVLSDMRTRFDYVIIDSSPLLAVTDAAILSAQSDGTLLIARVAKTKRDQIAHAVGMLEDVGATVLGAVLSMVPQHGSSAKSYSYYGYAETYGAGAIPPARTSVAEPGAESDSNPPTVTSDEKDESGPINSATDHQRSN